MCRRYDLTAGEKGMKLARQGVTLKGGRNSSNLGGVEGPACCCRSLGLKRLLCGLCLACVC